MRVKAMSRIKSNVPFEEQIEDIMGRFDFEKCRQVMVKMGWGYHDAKEPSTDALKSVARGRLEEVSKDGIIGSSCGRFSAYRDSWNLLSLAFEVESQDFTDIALEH